MLEINKQEMNSLLFSPVYLLNQCLGIIVPGMLLLLLLALKGNQLIHEAWFITSLGYKTKVALFLMLAYIIGSMLRAPFHWLAMMISKRGVDTPIGDQMKGQPPEIIKVVKGAIADGVIFATPGLLDRLSHYQTDGAFHIGIGSALLVASCVPGDGHLRWLEVILGVGMFLAGIRKAHLYKDEVLNVMGIGFAHVLGRMSKEQLVLAGLVFRSLGIKAASGGEEPKTVDAAQPASSEPVSTATL